MKKLPDAALAIILLAGLALACARILAGCSPSELPQVAAATGYEAQQLACVDQYADKPSIDKCRNNVKAAWAVDAGKDGSR